MNHRAASPGDDELVSLPTVAKDWLHCSLSQVHRFRRDVTRPLPVKRLGPALLRVHVGQLRAWIQQTPEQGV